MKPIAFVIQSKSNPLKLHRMTLTPNDYAGFPVLLCTCPAWRSRKTCCHAKAFKDVIAWGDPGEIQVDWGKEQPSWNL
jgi:hypothetical protein